MPIDVPIALVAIDNVAHDLTRMAIEDTLAQKKIDLSASHVGKVGLDPSNSVGTAFKVEIYPTAVLLDGQGVVRSVHVGIVPDPAKTFGREIEAIRAGKPVPKDGAEANKGQK